MVSAYLIAAGVVAVGIVIFVVATYNRLIVLRNRIENSKAQIDIQTKRRFDLVPNLVNTVKGYAKHERGVFNEVTKARASITASKTPAQREKAENMLTSALKSIFAVAENYPKLEASKNFLHLQEELSGLEENILGARQIFNDSVLAYNQTIQQFPTNLIAGTFGFALRSDQPYLKFSEESKKNVKVDF